MSEAQTSQISQVTPKHLARLAVVYVRVARNDAEGEDERALHQRNQRTHARAWGWGEGKVEVIEDPGQSGVSPERPGWKRLLGLLGERQVGAIFISDMSCLTLCREDFLVLADACHAAGTLLVVDGAIVPNPHDAFMAAVQKGSVSLNQAAVEADARLDGKFVLRTNTALPTAEVAQAYKSLWRVERTFREEKSTLEVRPVYHHRDDTTVGHIVACFLALRLEVDLQRRLDERGVGVAWPDLMRDLAQLQAVEVTCDGQRYRLRRPSEMTSRWWTLVSR